jgi:hypothetical protein
MASWARCGFAMNGLLSAPPGGRIQRWRTGPSCRVCGSSATRDAAKLISETDGKNYRAIECRSCDIFADPIPPLAFEPLQDVYDSDYTEGQRESETDVATVAALRDATHRQMDLVERFVAGESALNVGAMSGASRVLEERGWKLKVVDVSRHAAETARVRWGLDVSVCRIEDFEAPRGTFDFVKLGTCSNTWRIQPSASSAWPRSFGPGV